MSDNVKTLIGYICDGRGCEKGCNNPSCHHTLRIEHAKNFIKHDNIYMEIRHPTLFERIQNWFRRRKK